MFHRLFDVMFALLILIVFFLPMFIIGLIIKIDSKGPIFFIQQRMGKNQKLFNLVKFRTMTNKPRKPNGEVFLNNPEITQVGRILRRTKLDEIPQFINVLIGDMSVVGPRPCLKSTYEKFKNEDTDFRFLVKPGVTSNAGVSGSIYLSWKEKWSLDRSYAENKTFILDIKIILKTILVVILGEGRFKK